MKRSPLTNYFFFNTDILAIALHHKLPTDTYRVYAFIVTTANNAITVNVSLSVHDIARYCDLSLEVTRAAIATLKSKNII